MARTDNAAIKRVMFRRQIITNGAVLPRRAEPDQGRGYRHRFIRLPDSSRTRRSVQALMHRDFSLGLSGRPEHAGKVLCQIGADSFSHIGIDAREVFSQLFLEIELHLAGDLDALRLR